MSAEDKQVEVARLPTEWDPWRVLTSWSPARIGLGRAGAGMRTEVHLAFQAAHAAARDAVHIPWDVDAFAAALGELPSLVVASRATSRREYLQRPDLGRLLAPASEALLAAHRRPSHDDGGGWDVALVVTNGLSTEGIHRHGAPLVLALHAQLVSAGLELAPIVLASEGRVAVGDPIGRLLGARLVIVIVGERPSLAAADGVGLYLTLLAREALGDADRNCVSNVHPPSGLDYVAAAMKTAWLAKEALTRGYSGVQLKDESPNGPRLVREAEQP